MQKNDRYISVYEAEAMTGRKAATWRRDIRLGHVACVKLGRQIRIPLSEIRRLLKEGFRPRIMAASTTSAAN